MKRIKINLKQVLLASLVLACLAPAVLSGNAAAISAGQWNAGRIIDDSVFYNGGAMNTAQIQRFLNAKVPSCDTWGQEMYSGSQTRAEYAASRGVSTPFTCLKSYTENTPSRSADGFCRGIGSGNRTAAQIIQQVGQACGISPKALLVLLQKEQSLVTDEWPWPVQYQKATGYGCPDTAPCNSEYYGFFNQVYRAARQFKVYKQYPNSYNHIPFANNNVRYHPNSSCGSSQVFIRNYATAGLYNYTPYQPNQAALNNMYGTGDGCSAYGNRNFWRMYWDWFGSPIANEPYKADYVGQSAYPSLDPGQSKTVFIKYRNVGQRTWYDSSAVDGGRAPNNAYPIRLATNNPANRKSIFGSTWPGTGRNRPTAVFAAVYESDGITLSDRQDAAQPGQIVKFEFELKAPNGSKPQLRKEYFAPVAEGWGIMPIGTYFKVRINHVYTASYHSQSSYPTIRPGEQKTGYFIYKNTGNSTWFDDFAVNQNWTPKAAMPTRLATYGPINRFSNFGHAWNGKHNNRATTTFAAVYSQINGKLVRVTGRAGHVVQPGQYVKFAFPLWAPNNYPASTTRERFTPVTEGRAVMPMGTFLDVTVPSADTAKALNSKVSRTVNPGATVTTTLSFRNTGNKTWSSSSVYLTPTSPTGVNLKHVSWVSNNIVSYLNESSVAPGQVGTFDITLRSPYRKMNNLKANFSPASASSGVFGLRQSTMQISNWAVRPSAQFHSQSPYPTLNRGQTKTVYFIYKNTGNVIWYDNTGSTLGRAPANVKPARLATNNPINRKSIFGQDWGGFQNRATGNFAAVYDMVGGSLVEVTDSELKHLARPGQYVKFAFTIKAPSNISPGKYQEHFTPVLELWGIIPGVGTHLNVTVR